MPAKSKAQQKAAGAALAVKRGDAKKSDLKGASKGMVESMTENELEELARTKRKARARREGLTDTSAGSIPCDRRRWPEPGIRPREGQRRDRGRPRSGRPGAVGRCPGSGPGRNGSTGALPS